jgi:hypothetical protein
MLVSDLFDPQDLASYDNYVQSPESIVESLNGFLVVAIEEEGPSSAPSMGEEDESTAALHHSLSVLTFASIAYTFYIASIAYKY